MNSYLIGQCHNIHHACGCIETCMTVSGGIRSKITKRCRTHSRIK